MASSYKRCGFSKSQLCLQRILQIIASYPPQETHRVGSLTCQIEESKSFSRETRGLGIDLNVGLSESDDNSVSGCRVVIDNNKNNNNNKVSSDVHHSPVGSSTVGFSGDQKSSEGECECDPLLAVHVVQSSFEQEATKTLVSNSQKTCSDDGRLSLLAQAAEMVLLSGDVDSDKKLGVDYNEQDQETKDGSKRNKRLVEDLCGDFEDQKTPLVNIRSKRQRSQVMPSRYRDNSVLLDPWKPLPRLHKASSVVSSSTIKKKSR